MARTIRLQGDSNAHDRPWRVAVEQGFFKAEGLDVEYYEDNPKGVAGRVEDFHVRWKETQLQKGALEVYPVCEWGAIERVQQLGRGKIIGLDTTARSNGSDAERQQPREPHPSLGAAPRAAGGELRVAHMHEKRRREAPGEWERPPATRSSNAGKTEAAALMEPLVSRAA